jgi:uncharacterized beta-barrel protein YwiB (DUF1934 family)
VIDFDNGAYVMTLRKLVEIRIESSSPEQNMVQSVKGDLYLKGETVYIRYPEPDPAMGDTMTTVKISEQEIKVIRHGSIKSEQSFSKGKEQAGFYQLTQGSLHLNTQTKDIDIQLKQGLGTVSWKYGLYVTGDYAGEFALQLNIQEGKEE